MARLLRAHSWTGRALRTLIRRLRLAESSALRAGGAMAPYSEEDLQNLLILSLAEQKNRREV